VYVALFLFSSLPFFLSTHLCVRGRDIETNERTARIYPRQPVNQNHQNPAVGVRPSQGGADMSSSSSSSNNVVAVLQQYVQTVGQKLRFATSVRDARIVVQDVGVDAAQYLSQLRQRQQPRQRRPSDDDDAGNKDDNKMRAAIRTLMKLLVLLPELLPGGMGVIAGGLILSVLFRRLWLVGLAVWLVTADQVFVRTLTWIYYAFSDDYELAYALRYLRGWLRRFLKEGESIIQQSRGGPKQKQQAANVGHVWKVGVAHAFFKTVPTGISVVRHWIYYRSFALNDAFLHEELGAARYYCNDDMKIAAVNSYDDSGRADGDDMDDDDDDDYDENDDLQLSPVSSAVTSISQQNKYRFLPQGKSWHKRYRARRRPI
jgi:hypothetical protein